RRHTRSYGDWSSDVCSSDLTKRSLRKTGVKDVERGLDLKLRIENYTSNRQTKDFIVEQAHLMAPEVREKSGVWYRLNRWREEQRSEERRVGNERRACIWEIG